MPVLQDAAEDPYKADKAIQTTYGLTCAAVNLAKAAYSAGAAQRHMMAGKDAVPGVVTSPAEPEN